MKSTINIKKVMSSRSGFLGENAIERPIPFFLFDEFYCPHAAPSVSNFYKSGWRVMCGRAAGDCPVNTSGNIRDCYKVKGNK